MTRGLDEETYHAEIARTRRGCYIWFNIISVVTALIVFAFVRKYIANFGLKEAMLLLAVAIMYFFPWFTRENNKINASDTKVKESAYE